MRDKLDGQERNSSYLLLKSLNNDLVRKECQNWNIAVVGLEIAIDSRPCNNAQRQLKKPLCGSFQKFLCSDNVTGIKSFTETEKFFITQGCHSLPFRRLLWMTDRWLHSDGIPHFLDEFIRHSYSHFLRRLAIRSMAMPSKRCYEPWKRKSVDDVDDVVIDQPLKWGTSSTSSIREGTISYRIREAQSS